MGSSKKVLIGIGISLLVLVVILSAYLIWVHNKVELVLIGNEEINIGYLSEYKDEGFKFTKNHKEIEENSYSVITNNDVDTEKLGVYQVAYKVKYHGKEYEIKRTINVIDNEEPEITTNIDKVIKDYCTKKEQTKLEFQVIDNYDGDITNLATKEESEDKIIITVHDSSDNTSEKIIPIELTTKPKNVLKLNGKSTIKIKNGSTYEEPGATYQDGCGKVIDKNIKIEGSVDTSTDGNYKLTYTYEKTKESVTRTVTVYTPTPAGSKVIYLTFDDGPSAYTERVLATLDKYGVKATFFVTHQFPRYEAIIKKEYEAGHTVAVHTYTHNYNVYSSFDAYLNDFNLMNDVIEKYTGQRSKLFRFPGGSSNTVSRNYAKGIVTETAQKMTELGYVYFDWNVSSGDAGGATKEQVYSNIVNGVKRCDKCVVLMHDIKLPTVNALDDVLNSLVSSGYTLAPLTIDSPTAHQRINN